MTWSRWYILSTIVTFSHTMIDRALVNVDRCFKCGYIWLGGWDNENDKQDRVPFYCPHCKNVRWNQRYREEEDKLFDDLYKQHIVKVTTEEPKYKQVQNKLFEDHALKYPSYTYRPFLDTINRIAYLDFIAYCFFYGIRPQPDYFELKQVAAVPRKNLEKRHEIMLSIIHDRMQNSERYKQERYSKIIGKGKDKDYSHYYIYGKKTKHIR